jgi:hypothetical protein
MSALSDANADLLADDDFAVAVTYARGADSVAITAVPRRERTVDERDYGAALRAERRDYVLAAGALVLDGAETLPARGDTVTELVGDYEITCEVVDAPPDGCYRYADPGRTHLIVHAKQIARTAAGS